MYDSKLSWRWNRISSQFFSCFLCDCWYDDEKSDYSISLERLFCRILVYLNLSILRHVFTAERFPSYWKRRSLLSKRLRLSYRFVMAFVISWNFKEFILILEENIMGKLDQRSLLYAKIKYSEIIISALPSLSSLGSCPRSFYSEGLLSRLRRSRCWATRE